MEIFIMSFVLISFRRNVLSTDTDSSTDFHGKITVCVIISFNYYNYNILSTLLSLVTLCNDN